MSVQQIVSQLEQAHLKLKYEKLIDAGEVPYQMNLKAVDALNKDKPEVGKVALEKMTKGIDSWIKQLEQFSNVTNKISQTATAAIREA